MKPCKEYNMIVHSSDLEIADKFYERLIGLKLDYKNSSEIHLLGANYNILIKKQSN